MWFMKRPTPTPSFQETEISRLLDLVDSQARHIHRLEVALAQATGQPRPGPLRQPSRPLSPPSPPKVRGAESVSTMGREARREEEARAAVQEAFKLPSYMEKPTPVPPEQIPEGKGVGGGFSRPSEPSPDRSPQPESPSTAS